MEGETLGHLTLEMALIPSMDWKLAGPLFPKKKVCSWILCE